MKTYTLSEYAKLLDVSRQAVHKRTKTDLKQFVVRTGKQILLQFPDDVDLVNLVNPVNREVVNPVNVSSTTVNHVNDGEVDKLTQDKNAELSLKDETIGNPNEPAVNQAVNQSGLTQEVDRLTKDKAELTDKVDKLTQEVDRLTTRAENLEGRLQDKESHISTLNDMISRLQRDLEDERAAHKADRERDAAALAQAQERQHEAHVLLLQEQTKHKPFRLLLAEKAASFTNVFRRSGKNEEDPSDQT